MQPLMPDATPDAQCNLVMPDASQLCEEALGGLAPHTKGQIEPPVGGPIGPTRANRPWPGPMPWGLAPRIGALRLGFGALLLGLGALLLTLGAVLLRLGALVLRLWALLLRLGAWGCGTRGHVGRGAMWDPVYGIATQPRSLTPKPKSLVPKPTSLAP